MLYTSSVDYVNQADDKLVVGFSHCVNITLTLDSGDTITLFRNEYSIPEGFKFKEMKVREVLNILCPE
jgi:hypothetical protein